MKIRLVPMDKFHVDSVVSIEKNSFPTPWSRLTFLNEVSGNDFAYYVVALANNEVAGYAGMWVILDEGHITTIAVHPDRRREGIGQRLLNNLIEEAKRRGCIKMTLEARPSNFGALELYEKTGFVSFGLRPGYYTDTGEDAVIMWKELYPMA